MIGGHSIKSVHLGHKCPLTGYHHACADPSTPRQYDCLCLSKSIRVNPWHPYKNYPGRECSFIHLASKDVQYEQNNFDQDVIKKYMREENELATILQPEVKQIN